MLADPQERYSRTLIVGSSICTRCTPLGAGAGVVASSAVFCSSAAARLTSFSVLFSALPPCSVRRSFVAASGIAATIAAASSDNEYSE